MAFMGVAWGGIPIPQFGWHKFPEACRVQDWDTAAAECKITSPIGAGRNEAQKMMFLNAAAVNGTEKFEPELVLGSNGERSYTDLARHLLS